jgi:hypothetical protein
MFVISSIPSSSIWQGVKHEPEPIRQNDYWQNYSFNRFVRNSFA